MHNHKLLILTENIDKLYSVGIVFVSSVAALQMLNSLSPHPTSSSIAPLNYGRAIDASFIIV